MTDSSPVPRIVSHHWAVWLATGLGAGFAPKAPGTVGALWGLPLAWGIGQIPSWGWQAAVIAAICLVGIPICTLAARGLGGKKDPGAIVLDEIASLPMTFFMLPLDFSRPGPTALLMALGFGLHRLFDITKPPPARQLEHLPEGLGIMADDWIAGLYSGLSLWGIYLWNPLGIWT